MFLSQIHGLRREGKFIFIGAEYGDIKFHINEIDSIQIVDRKGISHTAEDLPVRNGEIRFLLKSGRKKTCHVRKLTKRKYKYLQSLLDTE